MARFAISLIFLVSLVPAFSLGEHRAVSQPSPAPLNELVALERSALDKWIRRDPQGYLDLYAPEVSYFDPLSKTRLDGIDAVRAMVQAPSPKPQALKPRMIRPLLEGE